MDIYIGDGTQLDYGYMCLAHGIWQLYPSAIGITYIPVDWIGRTRGSLRALSLEFQHSLLCRCREPKYPPSSHVLRFIPNLNNFMTRLVPSWNSGSHVVSPRSQSDIGPVIKRP